MVHFSKSAKGFSLLEIIVSLGIIAIILVLFFNVITRIIDVSIKTNARSRAREELSNITNLFRRDLRNAESIINCGEDDFTETCRMSTLEGIVEWRICDDNETLLCRYEIGEEDKLTYRMPDSLTVDFLSFDLGFSDSEDSREQNIIFNLSISGTNTKLGIDNLFANLITSTRNYGTTFDTEFVECGNGIVELGEECDDGNNSNDDTCSNGCSNIINVGINISGDCVTASCPPQAPYVISCNVEFSGDDDRACIGGTGSPLYFQEGNICSKGSLNGSIRCVNEDPGVLIECTSNKARTARISATDGGSCTAEYTKRGWDGV